MKFKKDQTTTKNSKDKSDLFFLFLYAEEPTCICLKLFFSTTMCTQNYEWPLVIGIWCGEEMIVVIKKKLRNKHIKMYRIYRD